MPAISVLIPHRHQMENDKALAIALSMYATNTYNDIELMVDTTTPGDPYVVINDMAQRASGEWLFFGNSDLFPAPNWDYGLMLEAQRGLMVTTTLVECGAIGVHNQNIHRDLGQTPDTFRRAEFETFVATNPRPPDGMGFYFYVLMNRFDFLERGMFDTSRGGFPTPLDSFFWDQWLADGLRIKRAAGSYFFHLQNFSNLAEQQKPSRHEQGFWMTNG